jgi:hypothetical protein
MSILDGEGLSRIHDDTEYTNMDDIANYGVVESDFASSTQNETAEFGRARHNDPVCK